VTSEIEQLRAENAELRRVLGRSGGLYVEMCPDELHCNWHGLNEESGSNAPWVCSHGVKMWKHPRGYWEEITVEDVDPVHDRFFAASTGQP
jgi:hypothetical protein